MGELVRVLTPLDFQCSYPKKEFVCLQSVALLFWRQKMKKVVIVSIIAAVFAVLAVVAAETGFFKSAEVEKPSVRQEIEQKNIEKTIKFVPKMKIQKIQTIDRNKLREAAKKIKEQQEKDPDFRKKGEKCGE